MSAISLRSSMVACVNKSPVFNPFDKDKIQAILRGQEFVITLAIFFWVSKELFSRADLTRIRPVAGSK